jgi:hypothetical protein
MKAMGQSLSFSLCKAFHILIRVNAITASFIFNSANKKTGVIKLHGLIIILSLIVSLK